MANLWLIVANWMLARVRAPGPAGVGGSGVRPPRSADADRHLTFPLNYRKRVFLSKSGPYSGIEPETSRLEVWRSVQLS